MKFSDRNMSEVLMDAEDQIHANGTYEIDGMDFRALLYRLEMAERCACLLIEYWHKDVNGEHDGAHSTFNPWLESKGERQL